MQTKSVSGRTPAREKPASDRHEDWRTVEIRTYDGNIFLVPNKDVLQNPIGAADLVRWCRGGPPAAATEAWVFEFGESSTQ